MNESALSRRDFLKGAGAAGAAAGAAALFGSHVALADEGAAAESAGAEASAAANPYTSALGDDVSLLPMKKVECPGPRGPIAFEDREIPESEIASTEDCEILIIGAGIGGLIASLKAAEEGAHVITLEKMTHGRAAWESLGAYNSKMQQEWGVKVDPVQLLDEIQRSAYWRTRPEPATTYIYRSGEVADFMQEMLERSGGGIKITHYPQMDMHNGFPIIDSYLTFDVPQEVSKTWLFGLYVCRDLCKAAESFDNLEIRYSTPAVQLIQDEDGRVSGAIAKRDGQYIRINASKGVLLATGGYDANPEMMQTWVRPEDYASSSWWNPSWGTTGDGHMMGLKVGAQMDSLPHPVMNFNFGTPESFIDMGSFMPAANFGILVNAQGKRFVNEDLQMQAVSNAINAQPDYGKGCWHIFDEGMLAANMQMAPELTSNTVKDYEAKGWLFEAATPEELAEKVGLPAEALAATIARYNGFIEQKLERDQDCYRHLGMAVPFMGGTYYALTTNSVILATVGGLTIDGQTHVLDNDNKPIPGLYATGNVSGNFFSINYPRHIPGTSVGRAAVFGFVAVENMLKGE